MKACSAASTLSTNAAPVFRMALWQAATGVLRWGLRRPYRLVAAESVGTGELDETGAGSPAVSLAFNTACAASCTVTTHSCTQSGSYWSATSYPCNPSSAWVVNFNDGYVWVYNKIDSYYYLRGVRGGS